MTVTTRVVPNITVQDIEAEHAHYAQVLGLSEVMNHGWIVTLANDARQPTDQSDDPGSDSADESECIHRGR